MSETLNIFFSNHLTILYQHLKAHLFAVDPSPFTRRIIVVYGPAMKSWLMLQMAQDPELQIATGLEFLYLNQAFENLLEIFQVNTRSTIPSLLELALAIEQELRSKLTFFKDLSVEDQRDWLPLLHYLKIHLNAFSPLKLTRKMERRLIGLSHQLARCFKDYERYGQRLLERWDKMTLPEHNWQKKLWHALYHEKRGWYAGHQALQHALKTPQPCEIYFFSISFMAACEFNFLSRLSQQVPVYYYLLSPCAVFWSDIRSDRETSHLHAHWQRKLGAEAPQVLQLEELLRDRNPLLANFGRLGREMAYYIEESSAQTVACYALPKCTQSLEEDFFENEDIHFVETNQPLTLLQAVQADILCMRNPQGRALIDIDHADLSIQLHVAPNKRREIEVLYHNLLNLIKTDAFSVQPSEILVLVPQLTDYLSYIHSVFGAQDSLIDYQILDLGLQAQSEIVQGFLQLLALSESRWDATHLLQLFEHPSFQRRHQLSASDYTLIQQWIDKTGIRWGETGIHRNELLKRQHCEQKMVEETDVGTWEHGLSRLLLGLTSVAKSPDTFPLGMLPYDAIDFSQGELLAKWIHLIHSLRDDLAPLHDGTYLTTEDWVNYLNCLLESYFQPDFELFESVDQYENLKAQFEVLRAASKTIKEARFSFVSIKTHLLNLLQQTGMTYRENQIQTVRFCSLVPLRSIPAKVIALVGMQEGTYPRPFSTSSLNLMQGKEFIDYCPSGIDYDRYLFLEALQSAQSYFLISYQGYNQQDSRELQPSLVIEELFSYLNKYYTVQGKKIADCCIFRHPFDAFNAIYFQKNSSLVNFSIKDYQTACIHYKLKKTAPYTFVEIFDLIPSPVPKEITHPLTIDLKQLTAVARNPIKFYLNQILEIYLQTDEERLLKNEEELFLSSLDKYKLKQSAIKHPLDRVLIRAEKEGKLPLGLFKLVATQKLKEEVQEWHTRLDKHQIHPQDIFEVEFLTSCDKPIQIRNDGWLFPALTVTTENNQQISITGKLSHVTPKGLLAMNKGTLAEAWKMWPQFLLYQHVLQLHPQPLEPQLILAYGAKPKKAFFEQPHPYLKDFLNYYERCMTGFSPLLPDWIPLILEGDFQGVQDKMRQLFNTSQFGEYQNPDLRWILSKEWLPNAEQLIHNWKDYTQSLVGDLMRHWYPTKGEE